MNSFKASSPPQQDSSRAGRCAAYVRHTAHPLAVSFASGEFPGGRKRSPIHFRQISARFFLDPVVLACGLLLIAYFCCVLRAFSAISQVQGKIARAEQPRPRRMVQRTSMPAQCWLFLSARPNAVYVGRRSHLL